MRKFNIIITSACILVGFSCTKKENSQPNVIYILMDDMGYGDLQCYGQQKIETPNIDWLRDAGMQFPNTIPDLRYQPRQDVSC